MNSSDIDARLQEYTAAEHRIGANLQELEDHAVYQLLKSGVLQGSTVRALSPVTTADPSLWELFSLLGTTLDRARSIRGTKSWIGGDERLRLIELLQDRSVLVRSSEIPLTERGLTETGLHEERTTIAGLIERMRALYEPLRDTVARAGEILGGLLPRLAAAEQTLHQLSVSAAELNLDDRDLDEIRETVERIRDLSLTDPLAIPSNSRAALDAALHHAGATIAQSQARHDAIANDLTDSADLLDRCRALIGQATADREQAIDKVVVHQRLPFTPNINAIDGPNGLVSALRQVGSAKEPWQQTRRELDHWLHQARRLESQLQSVADRVAAPLARRAELRGRLRAFRAKMAGTGRGEDRALSELSDEVHNELYTAPTDLDRADRLLHEFSQQLSQTTSEPGEPMNLGNR